MSENNQNIQPPSEISGQTLELAILPIKDAMLFPSVLMPMVVSGKDTIDMIDSALAGDKTYAQVLVKIDDEEPAIEQTDFLEEGDVLRGSDKKECQTPPPSIDKTNHAYELYEYGTRAAIAKMLKFPDGTVRFVAQGMERIKIEGIIQRTPFLKARVRIIPDEVEKSPEIEALARTVSNLFINIVKQVPYLPADEIQMAVMNTHNPLTLCYFIASNINVPIFEKQKILEANTLKEKLNRVLRLLNREQEIIKLGTKIQTEVQDEITKAQREHILREQMRAIQRELGEGEGESTDIKELKEKVAKLNVSNEVRKVAEDELNRLGRIHPSSAEYTVARTYLDWIVNLPWSLSVEDDLDIKKAQKILDEDHYGLEKVKERILEYLAVRKLKHDMHGPILCLVGPPGVGKTSLGRSIARAMGRKFYRMSVGGVHDEAEIRGHRRTYVGALPGRVLQGIRKAGSNNPIFMIDEIDKIGSDFRGDPSSALLEVLDPEQNFSFSDHYLEVPFDLSKVMFITTANVLDTIPGPLQDRMEVLELPGYTEDEKLYIAKRHLVPKQILEHGLTVEEFQFTDKAIGKIISSYTLEAGVRNLEREIATVCRKVAKDKVSSDDKKHAFKGVIIDEKDIEKYLGVEQFFSTVAERTSESGVVTGLAWTRAGGDILFIESTKMKGNQTLQLTGHLGDVMKESARAALSYIRSKAKVLGLPVDFYKDTDIHIHVPAGAIPKDGPSAGLTIAISLISLIRNKPVRPDVAMTGEITLRGKVLPVGGIKEKMLAARRAGIKTVLLPRLNEKDLKDISPRMIKGMQFKFVDSIQDSLKYVFK
ncbi:MAG: endopeptidase La [Planctomycetota bacterium]